jgi:ParB family chromosome partitioning protein
MTDRRRGLGRGLGALIPSVRSSDENPALSGHTASPEGSEARQDENRDQHQAGSADDEPPPVTAELDGLVDGGARFAELDPTHITSNSRQPRQVFDEDAHDELVRSVREVGVLQPVVVRRIAGPGEARYELVMGERRWRAAQAAGLPTIPTIIRETADDVMLRDALLENLHRAQLNPLEEAAAYDQLLQDFGCTQDELSERIGRSRPQISNTIRLLKLPPSVQRRIAAGVLSAGHARALLGLPDPAGQERLAQRVVAEGLSVRTVEEIVAVGDLPDGQPATRHRRPVAPALVDLAGRLSERFQTRVKVDLGKRRGRITVEFGSIDDLERIVAMMDPAGPSGSTSAPEPGPADDQDPSVERPRSETSFTATTDPAPSSAERAEAAAGQWAHVDQRHDAVGVGFGAGSGTDTQAEHTGGFH